MNGETTWVTPMNGVVFIPTCVNNLSNSDRANVDMWHEKQIEGTFHQLEQ